LVKVLHVVGVPVQVGLVVHEQLRLLSHSAAAVQVGLPDVDQ
jgi:hypothetical protein